MDISSLLNGPLGQQVVEGIANQLGIEKEKASVAVKTAVPTLFSALSNNAQAGGAQGILNALNNDHSGSILDNLGGFLSEGNFSDGASILSHVLGNKQSGVEKAIGKSAGISAGDAGKILMILAPIIMGYLGKQNKSQGLDTGGLTSLLGGLLSGNNQSGMGSAIEAILGGGNKGGGDLLGGLLGGLFGGGK